MEINGKKVVDAKRPAPIIITERDVKDGDNKNPSSCAAARAAKHSISDCLSARVHIGRVYIEQERQWVRYETPEALRTEIVSFDRGGGFQPGKYTLRPISPANTSAGRKRALDLRRGDRHKDKTGATKNPRKLRVAKVKRHEITGIRPKGANR
jgi:hypothetical protein